MNLALYKIAESFQALECLDDPDMPPEAVNDTLDSLRGDLTVKATNVAMYARNLEALAAQIKLAEQTMAHRRKMLENRAESIREYIKRCMETASIQKIDCPHFSLAIKKNPPAVEITDEESIPAIYMRDPPPPPPPAPDKKLIGDALKTGQAVPGARLIQGTRLDIK